jgi:hypothetical protein
MNSWQVWAQPWSVNLLFLVPVLIFLGFRREGLRLNWSQLAAAAIFASCFGFIEAAVVVYLRAAVGLLPGYLGSLADVRRAVGSYDQSKSVNDFPQSLLVIEVWREAATMGLLGSVATLAATRFRERLAVFFWTFAIWDSTYYAGLWATIRWPASLKELDVLFLIPVPWISQVWFPLLVSGLTVIAILLSRKRSPTA